MSQSPSTRKQCDFTKLIIAGYEIDLSGSNTQDFTVLFKGPKETAYEGGLWRIHVELPEKYPFASPSIGFLNKILHPNVDEQSGSVCLDVINQTWTPLYSLVNIFEVFLPQLLSYPNPSDPLNTEAAALYMRDRKKYDQKVKDYVRQYATEGSVRQQRCGESAAASSTSRRSPTKDSNCPTVSSEKVGDPLQSGVTSLSASPQTLPLQSQNGIAGGDDDGLSQVSELSQDALSDDLDLDD